MSLLDRLHEDGQTAVAPVDTALLAGKGVMITGATGLIGLNLIAALRHTPVRWIMAVSRTGLPAWAAEWLDDPRIVDMRIDRPQTNMQQPDYIVHAAGYGQPTRFQADPLGTIRVATQFTDRLLTHSLAPSGRFLFLSSSEVYSGCRSKGPHREGDIGQTAPDHPRAAYIEGKRCGEAIVHAHRAGGKDARIARVSLAYGPGTQKDDGRVLNQFMQQAIQNRSITMRDAGEALRTYCYIGDTCRMLLNILLHGRDHVVYNVGGRSTVSVHRLACKIAALENVPLTRGGTFSMAGAPLDVSLDMSRYANEFGDDRYRITSIDDGLERTYLWQKELYGG